MTDTDASSEPSLYFYRPSVAVAVIGVITFMVLSITYIWLFVRYRGWYFWAMYVGLCMECIGFTARLISVRNTASADAYIYSYLALLLAPSFMAAACYATFGRLLWWVTPQASHNFRTLWCSGRFVTPLFVFFDLGSFFIQLLGAGALGTAYASKDLNADDQQAKIRQGLGALKFGFALQLTCFGVFVVIGMRFLYVSRRWHGKALLYQAPPGANWVRLNWAVNLATIAITVRAVYRMAELSGSSRNPGYILRNEWPFWVFDALPMIGVFTLFVFVYPAQHLPLELSGWWVSTRKLRNKALSSPPAYEQAGSCLATNDSNISLGQV